LVINSPLHIITFPVIHKQKKQKKQKKKTCNNTVNLCSQNYSVALTNQVMA